MQLSKASAIYAAPIPLRLILALTFLWAGLGKVIDTTTVRGEHAALLANMGYKFPAPPQDQTTPDQSSSQPETEPETQPETQADPSQDQDPAKAGIAPLAPLVSIAQSQDQTPDEPAEQPNAEAQSPVTPRFTAADFTYETKVKSLNNLAILTYTAAHPDPRQDGSIPPPIWPEWAARDSWPIITAWAVAIIEIAAGLFVLIGLLTRLSAIALGTLMATAAWLTQIGYAIQSGNTFLGFLPNHGLWDTSAWQPFLWQLALMCAAFSLALAGPGAIALDRIPGSSHHDDDDDDFDDDE